MEDINVWTFFYGSYMDADILKSLEFYPIEMKVGKLHGYEISIDPLANLQKSDNSTVYGIVTLSPYFELNKLYTQVPNLKGNDYYPISVHIELQNKTMIQALCYIAPSLTPGEVQPDYVNTILSICEKYDFPRWYHQKIKKYLEI